MRRCQHIRHTTADMWRVSAAIIGHHLVRVVIQEDQQKVSFTTTPEGNCLLEASALVTFHEDLTLQVYQKTMPQAF